MQPLLECPRCKARLRLTKNTTTTDDLPQFVLCPKCKTSFTAADAVVSDGLETLEEVDDVSEPLNRLPMARPASPLDEDEQCPERAGLGWRLPAALAGGVVLLVVAVVGLMLAFGGHSDPESVAQRFADAWEKNDAQAIRALLTQRAQQANAPDADFAVLPGVTRGEVMGGTTRLTVMNAMTTGDTAEASLAFGGGMLTLRMRREGSQWRIQGVVIDQAVAGKRELDYEDAAAVAEAVKPRVAQPRVVRAGPAPRMVAPQQIAKAAPAATPVTVASFPTVAHRALDLGYLPTDAELIVSLRVADLWQSALIPRLVQALGPAAGKPLDAVKQRLGVELADIETITVALPRLQDAMQARPGGLGGLALPTTQPQPAPSLPSSIMVVRTRRPFDAQSALRLLTNVQQTSHAGRNYHKGNYENARDIAVFFADDRTLVAGSESLVQQAISLEGRSADRDVLQAFNGNHHLVVAVLPSEETRKQASAGNPPPAGGLGQEFAEVSALADAKAAGFGIALHATDTLALQMLVPCLNSADVPALLKATENLVQKARETYGKSAATPPPMDQIVQASLDSLKVTQQGNTVLVSGALPTALFEPATLNSLPALVLPLMLGGQGATPATPDEGNRTGTETPNRR